MRILRSRFDYIIVGIFAMAYVLSMTYLSLLKYYTFHATFLDLGLSNEVLWLLVHGGIANYYQSQFNLIYRLQYEKPIIFLIAPLYYIYPKPEFLLFLQTLFLGVTVFPLYVTAKRMIGSKFISGVISVSLLGFFPIVSANLFDFHYMAFFPFFYLMMVMYWSLSRKNLMILFAVLTASLNPLTLLLAIFFLTFVSTSNYFSSREKTLSIRFGEIFSMVVTVAGLFAIFILYYVFRNIYSDVGSTSQGIIPILFFDINAKLTLFLFLFGFLAFLPLLEPITIFLIAPYVGYVMLSINPGSYVIFGLMYTLLSVGPLYTGLIMAVSKLRIKKPAKGEPIRVTRNYNKLAVSIKNLRGSPQAKAITALIITSLVFTAIYFPFSPVNEYVQGGYFNGNRELTSITNVSPQVVFLHEVISLIPENASVLTENDIPQLSGRETVATLGLVNNISAYNYILIDFSFNYFSDPNSRIGLINNALNDGSFGVVAEGMGALLLERDYHSPPLLFDPYVENYTGNQFIPYGHSVKSGTNIIENYSDTYMWYGPYVTFLPGTYKFTFYLSSSNISISNSSAISLEINSGSLIYSTYTVSRNSFIKNNSIYPFVLNASFSQVTQYVEFRGVFVSGPAQLTLHSVNVTQESAQTNNS